MVRAPMAGAAGSVALGPVFQGPASGVRAPWGRGDGAEAEPLGSGLLAVCGTPGASRPCPSSPSTSTQLPYPQAHEHSSAPKVDSVVTGSPWNSAGAGVPGAAGRVSACSGRWRSHASGTEGGGVVVSPARCSS